MFGNPWSTDTRMSRRLANPTKMSTFSGRRKANGFSIQSARTDSAPSVTNLKEAKQTLLQAIAARPQVTKDILSKVEALERLGQGSEFALEDVSGRWSLIYSTQLSSSSSIASPSSLLSQADQDFLDGVIQGSTAALYRIFFKFAPALAGAQEGGDRQGPGKVKNEQIVDLQQGVVDNKVEAQLFAKGLTLKINVIGECGPRKTSSLPSSSHADDNDLDVVFTEFSVEIPSAGFGPFRIPLPRPRGSLSTTFCDDSMRISRGGRGGVFVLQRVPATAKDNAK